MRRSLWLAGLVATGLAGCVTLTEQTPLQGARLSRATPQVALRCAATLVDVVDARPAGEAAGQFNHRQLHFEGATALIREQMAAAGLSARTPTASDARVVLRLKRLYMAQQHTINTPVVVLEVAIDDDAPFLVRPRAESVNWWGSEDELYEDLGEALALANADVIRAVNARCSEADGSTRAR